MKNLYNFINYKPINRFKKIDANIKYFFIYFSGVSVASLLLGIVNENKDLNKGINWIIFVILIFLISFLLVELAKSNTEKYSTHYKFVGNFHNFSPVKLYLDRITDNTTHILSDKDKKYKAIKYLINEQSEFVIELYQIEQREIQRTLNNINKNLDKSKNH